MNKDRMVGKLILLDQREIVFMKRNNKKTDDADARHCIGPSLIYVKGLRQLGTKSLFR